MMKDAGFALGQGPEWIARRHQRPSISVNQPFLYFFEAACFVQICPEGEYNAAPRFGQPDEFDQRGWRCMPLSEHADTDDGIK